MRHLTINVSYLGDTALWKTPAEVADYGVNAMRRGRRVAIPSKIYRLSSLVGGKGPRAITLFALDRFWPSSDSEQTKA